MTSVKEIYRERLAAWSDVQEHLEFMHDLVIAADAKVVVELGVRSGNSTAALLAAVVETEGHLWSVDVDQVQPPVAFRDTGRWTMIVGNDLEVISWLPAEIDVLFVDTVHWYDHTLAELRLYGPRSKVILLHDTELQYPWMAPPTDPPYPVKSAIQTWVLEEGLTWENRPNCYGLGIIRR